MNATSTTMQDVRDARIAMLKADREYGLCLIECFGEAANEMRNTREGRGITGSDLHECYLDFTACRDYWSRLVEAAR